nr:signal peptide peptidase-like 2A [Dermatophagoides farinae]
MMSSSSSSLSSLFLPSLFIIISMVNSENIDGQKKEILYRTFKVLNVRNSTDYSKTQSLCTIDLFTSSSNLSIINDNDEYRPFRHHMLNNLCDPLSSSSSRLIPKIFNKNNGVGGGYHSFDYRIDCSISKQVENFLLPYMNGLNDEFPAGILFVTPCQVNITARFNITNNVIELMEKYNLTISVINKNKLWNINLQNYNQLRWPKQSKQQSSVISFIPMIFIFLIALITISIGSYWSGRVRYEIYQCSLPNILPINNGDTIIVVKRSSSSSSRNKNEQAFTNISLCSVIILVICMITALLLLYFFYKYLVYFILALFLITSMTSMFICLESFVQWSFPSRLLQATFMIPSCLWWQEQRLKFMDMIVAIISIIIPAFWFTIRHESENAWLLQDLLGFFFCINMLRTLRLPSLRICTYLMSILFLYDIFFVFITPLFTSKGQSIMVEVATGGNGPSSNSPMNYMEYRCEGTPVETLPMLFRVPQKLFQYDPTDFYDVCTRGSDSMLGYGDVMIPGLLIAYCSAFDRIENIPYHLYFSISLISYCLGLIVTFTALIFMEGAAQPALLYLVPFTLIPLFILAFIRRNYHSLWNGPEKVSLSLILNDNEQQH